MFKLWRLLLIRHMHLYTWLYWPVVRVVRRGVLRSDVSGLPRWLCLVRRRHNRLREVFNDHRLECARVLQLPQRRLRLERFVHVQPRLDECGQRHSVRQVRAWFFSHFDWRLQNLSGRVYAMRRWYRRVPVVQDRV
ncbi:hypothetical protein HGRIS_000146 [Hohenbuehelia grisea]|uniref:Secreted protein n=1 Tax=Hohenbuehelia grisea TaxID=104357 RepID=A0ABR3JQT9_9AGAR